jgi:hypothetical protein
MRGRGVVEVMGKSIYLHFHEHFVCRGVLVEFNEVEKAFLRVLCSSGHAQMGQDSIRNRLVADDIIKPEDFKALKKKLLYAGVIGIVYGNITVQDKSILVEFEKDEFPI